jgi:hypothetical protein
VQFLTWAPNYLTWPWYADHDVFATTALAWEAGLKPYRDIYGSNFPGTTYLFWVLGKLFGWGKSPAFFAVDASMVAALGGLLCAWSVRRFGRSLPGLVGFGFFLGYYLNLDYSLVAQRDWQGPFLAVAGLLLLQAWPGRPARWLSALLVAAGLAIRPQAIFMAPAFAYEIWEGAKSEAIPGRAAALELFEWGALLALGLVLSALPLIQAGVFGDFFHALNLVRFGGSYHRMTVGRFASQMCIQFLQLKILIIPAAFLLLGTRDDLMLKRTLRVLLLAFLCVLVYRPISPVGHAYLSHPLYLIWSILAALLAERVLGDGSLPAVLRLTLLLLVLGLGLVAKPRFSNPIGSIEAFSVLRTGEEPGPCPTGYAPNPEVVAAAHYEWRDYRDLLKYLRAHTNSDTRVANALKFVPAVTGPTARLPAFPAESVAWLRVVNAQDEETFARRLRESPNSVVVWSPAEKDLPLPISKLPLLTAEIERDYRFEARFGQIEVWRRK